MASVERRIRQVALVARELAPVVDAICDVFGLEVAYRDPGVATFGLENALMPVGDGFIEVVSPVQDGTTAGRLLDRRGGDGGYMVILQTGDLAAERARAEQLGVRVVWEVELDDAATIHLHPRDVGAAIVSFDRMEPPESWRWAGSDWHAAVHTERVRALAGAVVQSSDPEKTAARWSEVLGTDAPRATGEGFEIAVGPTRVRFRTDEDGRGDGVCGVLLRAGDAEAVAEAARARRLPVSGRDVQLGGVTFSLVD